MTTVKMDRARHALAAAETAVGLRAQAVSVPARSPAAGASVEQAGAASSGAAAGSGGAAQPAGTAQSAGPVAGAATVLAVPPALSRLFPAGGIRRGTAVQVVGSTSVLLSLAQQACGQEAWCALVGMPDVGLAAAAAAQLCLDRVVVVPRPGPDAVAVVGALLDGFDVLVLGPCPGLTERDRRALHSRLRHRGAVLLTPAPWPGADLILQAGASSWAGVGAGYGLLDGREMVITAVGRGAAAGRVATVRVRVGADGLVPAEQLSAERLPAGAVAVAGSPPELRWQHSGSAAIDLQHPKPVEKGVVVEHLPLWAEAG